MVMDGGTSRRALTTAMLDLASRGLLSFREEKGLLGHQQEGRRRRRPGRGRRRRGGPAGAQRPAPDRPGRGGRARRSSAPLGDRRGRLHHARRPAQVRVVGGRLRQGAREARRRPRLVRGGAEQGRPPAGPGGACSPSSAGVVALIVGLEHPDLGARADRRRGSIAGGIVDPALRPGHARRDDARRDDPGDARRLPADAREDDGAGALDAAGRRRGRARRGSRRPTRPSSGAPRWASRTRSRAS